MTSSSIPSPVSKSLSASMRPTQKRSMNGSAPIVRTRSPFAMNRTSGVSWRYRDPNPKDEMVCALDRPFPLLAGFRSREQSIELLRALEMVELEPLVELLGGGDYGSGTPAFSAQDSGGRRAALHPAASRSGPGPTGLCRRRSERPAGRQELPGSPPQA